MARQDYQNNRNSPVYSDIFINLSVHPGNNQLARHLNDNAVKRSLKTLIMTNPYERLFQPEIKSEIRKALFEPMGSAIATTIKTLIEEVIENNEPRANMIDVLVRPDYDQQLYTVTLVFTIINIPEPIRMDLTLNRVR